MPRDIESPNDSGARKRKGGQANVNGQVNYLSLLEDFYPSLLFRAGKNT